MASSSARPSARRDQFIASAGELVYLWGGAGDTEPETVFIYRHDDTETSWTREVTEGPHPPAGLSNGGCTISGQCLYLYGGNVGPLYHGDLYELNTKNWTWRKICGDGGAGGPGKKYGCRMISYQDQLLVVGGYYKGMPTTSRQAGASYDEYGRTNEVHSYNLTTGKR